ncbi:hypothetical protein [Lentzea atacamensis]|uniref:hypothetical protein n=1 Tax=Lentzea atacamensis TaxID=531938 RepID=UPI000DD4A142|nr:hypothetical protein [Lentzea atacamensis]
MYSELHPGGVDRDEVAAGLASFDERRQQSQPPRGVEAEVGEAAGIPPGRAGVAAASTTTSRSLRSRR